MHLSDYWQNKYTGGQDREQKRDDEMATTLRNNKRRSDIAPTSILLLPFYMLPFCNKIFGSCLPILGLGPSFFGCTRYVNVGCGAVALVARPPQMLTLYAASRGVSQERIFGWESKRASLKA